MKATYFKVYGQKSAFDKIILVAVVDDKFFGDEELPDQFILQAKKEPITIYSGTYPNIKFNMSTVESRSDQDRGQGISGIITNLDWYCVEKEEEDSLGIGL